MKLFLPLFISIVFINFSFCQSKVTEDSLSNLLNQAYVEYDKSEIQQSYQLGLELLELAEKNNNEKYIAEANYVLALSNETVEDYDKAQERYLTTLKIAEKLKDSAFVMMIYNGLGSIAIMKDQNYEKANDYYLKGLGISKALNDENFKIALIGNLCFNYLEQNEPEKIKPYLADLTAFLDNPAETHNKYNFINNANYFLGRYYTEINEYDLAEKHLQDAIIGSATHNHLENLSNSYQRIAELYKAKGDFQKAYQYLDEHRKTEKEFLKDKLVKELKTAEIKYDVKKYEEALELSKTRAEMMTTRTKNKNKLIWIYSIIFIGLLILFTIIYRENQAKKKLIAALHTNNEELKKAKEKASIAAEVKTQFITNVSHEIRTPLHGVVGITSLLLAQQEISEDNKRLLTSLKFSGDYLLSLINNVLLMSKIDNNKIRIQPRLIDLQSFSQNILNSISFIAEKKECKVVFNIEDSVPQEIILDDAILSEILINLIENGIKFTKIGTVTVSIKTLSKDTEKTTLRFEIADNGVGIPEDKKEIIFQKFSQISFDKSIMEGTGIGLSIVKSLLMLMGSDIHLVSEEGKGSTFYFDLSCKIAAKQENYTIHENQNMQYTGKKILLVEDNEINKMITEKFLSPFGFDLEIISDGKDSLEALKNNSYDIVLLDINIPSMNGFEITREIRKTDTQTPIIAVTATELSEIKEEVEKSGMNDILIKPFNRENLIEMIKKYLS